MKDEFESHDKKRLKPKQVLSFVRSQEIQSLLLSSPSCIESWNVDISSLHLVLFEGIHSWTWVKSSFQDLTCTKYASKRDDIQKRRGFVSFPSANTFKCLDCTKYHVQVRCTQSARKTLSPPNRLLAWKPVHPVCVYSLLCLISWHISWMYFGYAYVLFPFLVSSIWITESIHSRRRARCDCKN